MRGRSVAALLLACALLLAGACSRGQDEAAEAGNPVAAASTAPTQSATAAAEEVSPAATAEVSSAASAVPSETPPAAVVPPPAAPAGPAPTQLVGVAVAAPPGYQVVALPQEYASQLTRLAQESGQQVTALEAAGITDADGNEAAVVLVTRYSGIDVTTPAFDAQRRTQAETQGSVLADEVIAGTAMLTSATPPLVSWTQGQDTLIVVSSTGVMGLEELREVAAAMLAAG